MATATLTPTNFYFLHGSYVSAFDFTNAPTSNFKDDYYDNNGNWIWDLNSYVGTTGDNYSDTSYHAVCFKYTLPSGSKTFESITLPISYTQHVPTGDFAGGDSHTVATLSTQAPSTSSPNWRFSSSLTASQIIGTGIDLIYSTSTLTFSNLNFTTSATTIYLYIQINERNTWDTPLATTRNHEFTAGTLTYNTDSGTSGKSFKKVTPYIYFSSSNKWYPYTPYIYFSSSNKWYPYKMYVYKS